ncbi:hypothetical protein QWY75_11675 [Pontixanthobacter aestiaquae]|uniref:Uncharacterized protein n=1 Tax=Pontixanthobacter aestiaquae TaxID=1509367 RepID=A0A844Z4Y2_9SPHN|nr:hypothetical protein [Pontixanthobacter aestiaquae]MDN3646861.1 hypothetical protein [Pontixanthobacter aestiaquae]MXO82157.1 hypothetical protein [Pontixanthobacter aestiaquae]
MKAIPRRDVLAALGAIWALNVFAATSGVNAQSFTVKFTPPSTPMRFTRKLVRNLSDGKQIVVERAWKVLFAPVGQGFSLDGEQISVEVSVPPGLEALADLERRKRESGLFPLMLASDGMIVRKVSARPKAVIDQAIELASQELAARGVSEADQSSSREFLRTLQSSAEKAASHLPRDLFQPRRMAANAKRTLSLPDGAVGSVAIEFTAKTDAETGLMRTATRTVTTKIALSERTSAEHWSLVVI